MKNNVGVTLIALIITIIVLIILATVSINIVFQDNGIISQIENAKKVTINSQVAEEEELNILYDKLDNYINEVNLPSTNETKPYFPDSESKIIEDSNLETGLTIKDKNKNEWVWIIVPKSITSSAKTEDEIYTQLKTYTSLYKNNQFEDTWYEGCGLSEEEYNTNKAKMLNSIKNNGGFWIGRYELGADTIATGNAYIQIDKYPYNYITVSQAQQLCSTLSTNSQLTSSMLYGVQWDLVLKYMEENAVELGATTVDRQMKLKNDSSSWGNYINVSFELKRGKYSTNYQETFHPIIGTYIKETDVGTILTTGTTTRNKILNIYDLAGNQWEWTLEKGTILENYLAVHRGGDYGNNGANNPVNFRNSYPISSKESDVSTRATLF